MMSLRFVYVEMHKTAQIIASRTQRNALPGFTGAHHIPTHPPHGSPPHAVWTYMPRLGHRSYTPRLSAD